MKWFIGTRKNVLDFSAFIDELNETNLIAKYATETLFNGAEIIQPLALQIFGKRFSIHQEFDHYEIKIKNVGLVENDRTFFATAVKLLQVNDTQLEDGTPYYRQESFVESITIKLKSK